MDGEGKGWSTAFHRVPRAQEWKIVYWLALGSMADDGLAILLYVALHFKNRLSNSRNYICPTIHA